MSPNQLYREVPATIHPTPSGATSGRWHSAPKQARERLRRCIASEEAQPSPAFFELEGYVTASPLALPQLGRCTEFPAPLRSSALFGLLGLATSWPPAHPQPLNLWDPTIFCTFYTDGTSAAATWLALTRRRPGPLRLALSVGVVVGGPAPHAPRPDVLPEQATTQAAKQGQEASKPNAPPPIRVPDRVGHSQATAIRLDDVAVLDSVLLAELALEEARTDRTIRVALGAPVTGHVRIKRGWTIYDTALGNRIVEGSRQGAAGAVDRDHVRAHACLRRVCRLHGKRYLTQGGDV